MLNSAYNVSWRTRNCVNSNFKLQENLPIIYTWERIKQIIESAESIDGLPVKSLFSKVSLFQHVLSGKII